MPSDQREKFYQYFEQALEKAQSPDELSWIDRDSALDVYRNEPEFQAILAKHKARLLRQCPVAHRNQPSMLNLLFWSTEDKTSKDRPAGLLMLAIITVLYIGMLCLFAWILWPSQSNSLGFIYGFISLIAVSILSVIAFLYLRRVAIKRQKVNGKDTTITPFLAPKPIESGNGPPDSTSKTTAMKPFRIALLLVPIVGAVITVAFHVGRYPPPDLQGNGFIAAINLQTLHLAQHVFKRSAWYRNSRKGTYANGAKDLYALASDPTKTPGLIDKSFSDAFGSTALEMISPAKTGKIPKCGYVYVDLSHQPDGKPVDLTFPQAPITMFTYCAYPSAYNETGTKTYIVDTHGAVYAKDMGGEPITKWPSDLSGWLKVHDPITLPSLEPTKPESKSDGPSPPPGGTSRNPPTTASTDAQSDAIAWGAAVNTGK